MRTSAHTGVAIPRSFRLPHITHVIANQRARWCGPLRRFPPVTIRFSLAPTLGELAAKPTERVKTPSLPLAGHLSHGERQDPHPSRLRRATFPMGEGFSPGLVHRYKNRIQKLCVLHRKSCVLGRNHPILHFDEKRIAIAAPFVYNVCIAVPGTQAKSYGSTVFPKGVFDHYVYC